MKLPEFAVKQPVATMMLFLALGLIGVFSLTRLNIDMFPDIDPPVISILTSWRGASASDIEIEVTEKIENFVNSVNNLDTLTSSSLDNLSIITCKFDWGTDLDVATNDIRDKLEFATRELPDDVDSSLIFKFSSASAPVMVMTISGEKSWPRLYHLADKNIGDSLKRVPGVGAVIIHGGLKRQINIYFDLAQIEGFNLSLPKINQILASENINMPAGTIKSGLKDYFIRVPARFTSMEQIKNVVVGYYKKNPVYLKDVAEVADDYESKQMNAWGDNEPALVLLVQKQTGKNTVKVIQGVKEKLKELEQNLPSDVKIHIIMDSSEDILNSLRNLRNTFSWGIGFIILVTILFLRRIRTVFIIVLMIPFSLIIAFTFLYLFGYTINLISLMALAIASGMVVDNGIVVLENIIRHLEKGGRVNTAAIFGAGEMGMAITASTMTTVIVFVPLMFLSGLSGIIFKQLGFVVIVTLLASLLTALLLTPMLCSKWLKATPRQLEERRNIFGRFYAFSEKGFQAIERVYQNLLQWSLDYRKIVILMAVIIFLSSLSLISFLSTSLFPVVDTGSVSIRFRLTEGTRLEETDKVIKEMLNNIDEMVSKEEIRHSYAMDGETKEGVAAALGFDQGPNVGTIGFKLVDRDKRFRSAEDIAAVLRDEAKLIPGISHITVKAESTMSSAMSGGGKPISLEIQGQNLEENLAFARQIKEVLKEIPGLVDLNISQKNPRPELWVEVDRKKATDLGLNIAIVAASLRNYFYGIEATEFKDDGDSFNIITRFSEKDKNRLANLPNVPIIGPGGQSIKLKNIASITNGEGPIEIERKNRQRIIKVEGDLYQRSLGDVTVDIKDILADMGTPPGIFVAFGGDVEEQKKAFKDLTTLLILGIILVYMIMASLFGNLRDPFIVMFSVPFAFSGVIYAYYFTNTSLGIMSFMGIIMLMGIVVNNAIVLIDYIHLLLKRGFPLAEAITKAGKSRLRPVLMTTMTTFFGMLPMATSNRVGAEAWNPLGITMLGGLSVSTLVTLILIPTIFYFFEKRKIQN